MRKYFLVVFLLMTAILHAGNVTVDYDSKAKALVGSVTLPPGVNFSSQEEYQQYVEDHTIIIVGKNADLFERMALEAMKIDNPWLGRADQADEGASSDGYIVIFLVGGPEHNGMTKQAEHLFGSTNDIGAGIMLRNGRDENGTVFLSISDEQGMIAAKEGELGGAKYSPLYGIVPSGMEAPAATLLSLIILAIINVARTVFEFKALEYGRNGQKVGEGALFFHGINLTELGAISGASAVLGVSISWQFFGPTIEFLNFIAINSVICLMAALIHEITHRIVGKRFGIKVEYRFWKAGSTLTLLSSYLGNAFSIQGFVLEEIEPGTEKNKVGLMKVSAPIVSAFCMIGFAAWNVLSPSPLLYTAYTTSALWAMAEILPFKSLDGDDIRKWNFWIWLGAFLFIGTSYVIITFFI